MKTIIVHTMKDCHLCEKCHDLLNYWGLEHTMISDMRPLDEPYPIIYVDGQKHSYEMLLDKIMNGELGLW